MWTKAKNGQLFTCQPLILRWSPIPPSKDPPPPPPRHCHPEGWHRQEGKTSHLQARQWPAPARPCKGCTLPWIEAMMRCLATQKSPDWDIFKTRSPKNRKKAKYHMGCFFSFFFFLLLFLLFLFFYCQCFTNHRNQYCFHWHNKSNVGQHKSKKKKSLTCYSFLWVYL